MSAFTGKYKRLEDQDSLESSACKECGHTFDGPSIPPPRPAWLRLYTIVLPAVSVLVAFLSVGLYLHERSQFRGKCWDAHNYYSPAGAAVRDRSYETLRFEGSLWHESPYKGPPSPAVNAAWTDLLNAGIFAATASDLRRVGHHDGNLSTAVRFPPEVVDRGSDGEGGYMVTTVGTHQLHCLHYLWQDHHQKFFPDVQDNIKEIPEMYERHYEHCVDYIRQSLTCAFDTTLVTYDWVRQHQNPTPNSNSMHKCVDNGAMKSWLKAKAITIPDGFTWKQPPGQISLSENP